VTLWDESYTEKQLKGWFYNKRLLNCATREWFINLAKSWGKNTLLLDAGCGAGVTGYQLLKNDVLENTNYVGVDFSDCMLNLARKKVIHKNALFIKDSLESFTYSKKFDKILLRAVLEHNLFVEGIINNLVINNLSDTGSLYIIFWNNPVNGKSKINYTPGGFYDNSFSKTYLENLILSANATIKESFEINEKSFNSMKRVIWEVCKK